MLESVYNRFPISLILRYLHTDLRALKLIDNWSHVLLALETKKTVTNISCASSKNSAEEVPMHTKTEH